MSAIGSRVFQTIQPFSAQVFGLGFLAQLVALVLPWAEAEGLRPERDLLTPFHVAVSLVALHLLPQRFDRREILGVDPAARREIRRCLYSVHKWPYLLAGMLCFSLGALTIWFNMYGALLCLAGLGLASVALIWSRRMVLSVGMAVATFGTTCIMYDHWMATP
ncbi:hypothetical protein H696_06010 [Fonticula alba]|uniref:Tripartite tricarboxylate transporter TctB family protein n=1 Tax=Fonticula alba TaxID=691883 RepID=A0A058YZT3_FONAL|nr:hypothetical protein H696_06010 [Fonticula alba]KCV67489.1 hypothetical protein H696_06010 [Fonticula alba]|eukprot:XP_009498050.1 hypothetical protein H696_06010 [Fonticula alba]